jgi:hypothetical protein
MFGHWFVFYLYFVMSFVTFVTMLACLLHSSKLTVPLSQCFMPFVFWLSLPPTPRWSPASCLLPRPLQWICTGKLIYHFEKIHKVGWFHIQWWFKPHDTQLSNLYPPKYYMIVWRKPNNISKTWTLSCSKKIQKKASTWSSSSGSISPIVDFSLIQFFS